MLLEGSLLLSLDEDDEDGAILAQLRAGDEVPPAFASRPRWIVEEGHQVALLLSCACGVSAAATLFMEPKLLHGCSWAAHVEGVLILLPEGVRLLHRLVELAQHAGCYKLMLDAPKADAPALCALGFEPTQLTLTAALELPADYGWIGGGARPSRLAQCAARRLPSLAKADCDVAILLRPLALDDPPHALMRLLKQLSRAPSVPPEAFAAHLSAMQGDSRVPLVVEIRECGERAIVGCATLIIRRRLLQSSVGFIAHIEDVVVDSSLRGLGLGKVLILALLQVACEAGCSRAVLNCNEHNANFYAKCGFERCGMLSYTKYFAVRIS